MTDWFEEWFGEKYLALHAHRDEDEAERVATLIDARVRIAPDAPALGLACGRHSRALTEHWCTHALGVYDGHLYGPDSPRTILIGCRR